MFPFSSRHAETDRSAFRNRPLIGNEYFRGEFSEDYRMSGSNGIRWNGGLSASPERR